VKRIAQELASRIRDRVRSQVENLQGATAEFRTVFHGPPHDLMLEVLQLLEDEGGIEVVLPNGQQMLLPVLLQLDQLPSGQHNPAVGASGQCEPSHLLSVRNSRTQALLHCLPQGGGRLACPYRRRATSLGLRRQTIPQRQRSRIG
jgi:DNA phosphorothioation-dependent restriction protein DptH